MYNIAMLNKTKINFRQNNYNTSDSGVMFLLALFVPQFLMLVVTLICATATGLPFSSADPEVATFISTYPTLYVVLCGLVPQVSMLLCFFFLSERKKINYAKANQISFKTFNWKIMLIVLAIGVVCLFGFSAFVNWFDYIVKGWGYTSSVSNIDVKTFGKFIGAVFYIGLMPAICEELVFRGVITNGLKENGTKVAVVLSAVLFALMHQNLQQFFYQLFLGGVMAYIVLKTGNILYTMLLHFLNNFCVLLDGYISSKNAVIEPDLNAYYSNPWNNIWPFLVMLLAVAVVVGLLVLLNYVIKKQKSKIITSTNEQISISHSQEENKNVTENQATIEQTKQNISPFKNIYFLIALIAGIMFWILSIYLHF